MAEFKFFCPQCGQHIQCGTSYSGQQINCPVCQQAIVVPQAPRVAPAVSPPVAAQSRALRNVLVAAAALAVLAGLAIGGWYGWSKIRMHSRIGKLPPGVVAFWSGDDGGKDGIGGNNGTLVNVTLTDGIAGRAFHLNGTNSYIQIPDSAGLKPENITVQAWVKFDVQASPDANLPGQQSIVFKLNTRDPHRGNFTGYNLLKNVDHFCFSIGSAAGNQVLANSRMVPQVGIWYFVVGTYDAGKGEVGIYVNGVLEGGARANFPLDCGTRPLFIGTTGEWWDGKLQGDVDRVAIYNRALSADEINAVYTEQK